jgi:hypothetical protein
MEEASSHQLPKALGEGRVEITFNSKTNPPVVRTPLIQVSGRRLASKLLRRLDADRGERESRG